MQRLKLLLFFLSVAFNVNAQGNVDSSKQRAMDMIKQKMMDSIKSVRIDEAALMYPRIRQFSITHQSNGERNIRSKIYGNDFFLGRLRSSRTIVNMNIPIWVKNKNTVVGSLSFVHQFFDLNDITSYSPNYSISEETRYVPMFNFALTVSRRDTVLNIPFSLTASLGALFNPDFASKQLRFLGILTVPVIRSARSNMTMGLIVNIDPSSLTPVIPLISYSYKFKALGIDLMADLPYRVALRKQATKRASLTVFSEMAGNNSFFGFNDKDPNPTLPSRMTFATTEINSGLMLEYRLTKKAVISFSGGVNAALQSRIFRVGAKQNDYLISNRNNATPFISAGVSLLPFWNPFKQK